MKTLLKIRYYITAIILPFIKLISKLGKPEPRRNQDDLNEILKILRPGDVLLTREDYRLSNLFIKGFWGHAAIAVNDGILEALPPKVRKSSITEFVLSVDSIVILRPTFPIEFTDIEKEYLDKEYDFWFLPKNDMWFCSELCFDYLTLIAKDNGRAMGKVKLLSPQDYYNSKILFEVMYERR